MVILMRLSYMSSFDINVSLGIFCVQGNLYIFFSNFMESRGGGRGSSGGGGGGSGSGGGGGGSGGSGGSNGGS